MNLEITRLDSGLAVVSHAMPHLETVSLGVWVGAGARYEAVREHGVAHYLEHMAFKGTETRSARQIAEEIENVGGDLNAATSLEHTAYYVRALADDREVALDVLADILLNPVFSAHDMALERDVIIQEIGAAQDTPDDQVFERFQLAAFPDQTLGRSILGTVDALQNLRGDDLQAFRVRHYLPGAMVVGAAGKLDHDRLVADVVQRFESLRDRHRSAMPPARFHPGESRLDRALEQVHLVLGFEGVSFHDPDFYAAQVLSGVLGGGMSSRLFQEVRERRGLCYSVFSFASSYSDAGVFGIYAGTGPESLAEIVPVICGELNGLIGGIGEDEVSRARAQIKAGLLIGLESAGSRSEQIARQLMVFDRVLPIDEIIAAVDAVDARRLSALAGRLFRADRLCVSALGPLEQLESRSKIAARFNNVTIAIAN